MKALYVFLLPLTLLVGACSGEDDGPRSASPGAIVFHADIGASSRDALDGSSIREFKVWGWANYEDSLPHQSSMLFQGQEVSLGGSGWGYSPPVYWWPGRIHRFLALATNKAVGSGLSTTASPTFTIWGEAATVGLTLAAPYEEDIVYAFAERVMPDTIKSGDAQPVNLSFRHALARLKINVKAATIDDCHVRLRSISFKPYYTECSFAPQIVETHTEIPPTRRDEEPTIVTTRDYQLPVTSTRLATDFFPLLTNPETDTTPFTNPYASPYMYLVPGRVGTIEVSCELWENSPAVEIDTETVRYEVTGTMEAGHSYEVTILLPSATNVVTLQGSLEPWGDDNDTDREILSL